VRTTASQAGIRARSRATVIGGTTPSAPFAPCARSRVRRVCPPPEACQQHPRCREPRPSRMEKGGSWAPSPARLEEGGSAVDPRLGAPPARSCAGSAAGLRDGSAAGAPSAGSCVGSAAGRPERCSWSRWSQQRRCPWLQVFLFLYICPDKWVPLVRNFGEEDNCKKTRLIYLT
jgi:hypothetical protein